MSETWFQRSAKKTASVVALACCLLATMVRCQEIPVQIVDVDLSPLVEALADSPARFAVPVRASAELDRHGRWSESGGLSRWRHSMRVPAAISMSFLADRISLPPGATLKISNGDATFQYTAQDIICEITPGNQGPAKASVALVVANQYQCSGTLVNNARRDGTPYVLTARHCQGPAGGLPHHAASVTVYWEAQTGCAAELVPAAAQVPAVQTATPVAALVDRLAVVAAGLREARCCCGCCCCSQRCASDSSETCVSPPPSATPAVRHRAAHPG